MIMTPFKLLGDYRVLAQDCGDWIIRRDPQNNDWVFTLDGDFRSSRIMRAASPEALIELARPFADHPELSIEELEYLEVEGW